MATSFASNFRPDYGKPPGTAQSNVSFGQGGGNPHLPPPATLPSAVGVQNPMMVYQHIQDISSKRISTLDYLRKA